MEEEKGVGFVEEVRNEKRAKSCCSTVVCWCRGGLCCACVEEETGEELRKGDANTGRGACY